MAILNFPNEHPGGGPLQTGDTYTGDNGVVYTYDGVKWVGRTSVTMGYTGYTGSTGTQGITGFTGSTGTIGYTGSRGDAGGNANTANFVFTASQVSVSNDGDITLVTNANTWTFAADGTLTLPASSPIIWSTSETSFINFNGAGPVGPGGDLILGTNGPTNVVIAVDDSSAETLKSWVFDTNGVLTLPNGLTIDGAPGNYGIRIGGTSTWISVDNEGAPPGFMVATAVGGADHRWLFADDGTLTAPGHLLPDADLAYDLGSTTTQWRSIYVGTGTIFIGGVALGVNQDNYVTVDGNPIITVNTAGNLTLQGDVNIGTVTISDTAPTATTGTQWFDTVEGRTYVATGGVWLDASPTQIPSPETYLGEIIIDGTTIMLPPGGEIIDSNGNVLLGGAVSLPSWITVVADTEHLPTLNTDYGWDSSGAWSTNATILDDEPFAGNGTSFPFRTTFSIPNDTKSVTTVDFVVNDIDEFDFGITVFASGTTPTWEWGGSGSSIDAKYGITELYGISGSGGSADWEPPSLGTYRARLTVDPTGPGTADITLETLSTGGTVLDTITYTETSFFNTNYKIGFASDQDNGVSKTYFKNLTINIDNGATVYTDTLMNGNSVGGSTTALGDRLTAGSNSVVLSSTGTLTLPQGGTISEVTVTPGGGGNPSVGILLTPFVSDEFGTPNPDMAVKIYPTFNDDDHIHIVAGNPTTVDLFLGDDDQYVKIEKNHGNIVVGTNTTVSNSTWTFGTDGVLTLPAGSSRVTSYGQITMETDNGGSGIYLNATGVNLVYANTNVTLRSNSTGTTNDWTFGTDGVLTLSTASTILGNSEDPNVYIETLTTSTTNIWTFAADGSTTFPDATVQTTAYVNNRTTGSWTLATGSNTVSITVPLNSNYQMWVNGNIPNGIVEWNATVNVSNPNVPAIGSQYAWYYMAGNALVLTAIPDQIVGTVGVISTSTSYAGTASNVFAFGITNNSTSSQVINWGYTTL